MDTPAGLLKRGLARQFLRFATVGAFGTGAHYLALALLMHTGWPPTPATATGALLGAGVNYWLNYHYTFASRRPHRIAGRRFAVLAGLGWLLNSLAFHFLHYTTGWPLWPAQLATTGLVLVANFAGNRWWTFSGEHHG